MKKRFVLFLIFSIICVPICLGLSACNKKSDPDVLECKSTINLTYGESVDLNKLDVTLTHPNGEKETINLKTNENQDGFTFETISSTADHQLDLVKPAAGLYYIKISFRDLAVNALIVVSEATYPNQITLTAQSSIEYLTEKPTLTLEGLSGKATINYHFKKQVIENGQPIWINHINLQKEQVEDCEAEAFFTTYGFEVGKYKVYATLNIANYAEYSTNEVEFDVTKTSLAGKYYIDVSNLSFEYNPEYPTLAGYSLVSRVTLAKDNRYTGPDLDVNGTFAWKEPTKAVAITSDEGEQQTIVFSSKNYTLSALSDEYNINVIFTKAEFPYWNISLALDGERIAEYSYVDLADYYDFSLLVSNSIDETYIEVPESYTYRLLDSNDTQLVNNRYVPTAADISAGSFRIKYQIDETENNKGRDGSFVVYIRPVAQVNDISYTTLDAAINRAMTFDSIDTVATIKLLKDINEPTQEYSIKVNNSLARIVFDLNNHILRLKKLTIESQNGSNLEQLNITITHGYLGTYQRDDGGNVSVVSSELEEYAIVYSSWSNLSLYITNAHVASYLVPLCSTPGSGEATIILSDSEFVSTSQDSAHTGTALFLSSFDNLAASDCSFSGYSAAYIKAGANVFSNCIFAATGLKKEVAYNQNGFVSTGAAIVIDNTQGYSQPSTVLISGGKTSLVDPTCSSVQEIITQDDGEASDYIVVTLSNFNTSAGAANMLLKNGVPTPVQASTNTNYTEEEPDTGE